MKLCWQIVRKDFGRLRGRLIVWWVVVAAKGAWGILSVLGADGDESGGLRGLFMGGLILGALDVALTLLLAGLLVQGDGLRGTTAAWRTRPISGGRLLAAKAVGATVLLAAPAVLLALPWWLFCGLTAPQIGLAAAAVLVAQGLLIGLAMTVAVLTDSPGRLFVWGGVGVAALMLGTGSLLPVVHDSSVSIGARLATQLAILAITGAVVVTGQYLTRRWRRALIGLGAGGLLSIGAAVFAPVDLTGWIGRWRQRAEWNAELAREVAFEFESARRAEKRFRPEQQGARRHMLLSYLVHGLPPGHVVAQGRVTHAWTRNDFHLSREDWLWGYPYSSSLLRTAFGVANRTPVRTPRVSVQGSLWLAGEQLADLGASPTQYRARVSLDLVQPRLEMEFPLASTRWQARSGHGVRVSGTLRRSDGASIVVVQTESIDWLEVGAQFLGAGPGRSRQPAMAVLQRSTGYLETLTGATEVDFPLGGVLIRTQRFEMRPGRAAPELDDDSAREGWFGGLTLALVSVPTVATFEREIAVEGFELRP